MKTYYRILRYVKPYWKHLLLSIIFTILFSVLNGASIYLTIPMLDTLFQESERTEVKQNPVEEQKSTSMLPDSIEKFKYDAEKWYNDLVFRGTKLDALFRICIIVFIAFLLKNIFGYLQAYFLAVVEQGAMRDLRNEAYGQLQLLPLSFYKKEKTGNLISRITNDVNIVQGSIAATFLNLIREPLSILVFLGIAISLSWRLTLLSFIILPLAMIIITTIGLKLRKHSSVIQSKMADITSILQETISGVKIVKAFGMQKFEYDKFTGETNRFYRLMLKITRVRNISSPTTETISVFIGIIVIYYGGTLVLQEGSLTASKFLGFLFSIFQMMTPIKELSGVNNRIQETSAAAERVFEIIDTEATIYVTQGPEEIDSLKNNIELKNVSFRYDDGEEDVLSNINLKVNKGEIAALVGPSGGGKSTLIDLIPRFFDVTGGSIQIDGTDIRKFKVESLRKIMGIVTQETFLFNDSIRNNIAYGLTEMSFDHVVEAAKVANAHKFIEAMPEGYNTIIGERGVKLSGGQRQRLSIARALLKNPDIMIFDEATSALDNESEVLVQEAIERLMANRTTFVIAHRLSTIRNASKIFVIDKGRIIQEGTNEELLKNEKGLYYKLYDMQFKV